MSKIKITQKQYDTILLHEQQVRGVLLNEGTKELVLTIALLAGLKLTGQNEYIANNSIKDLKNLKLIQTTLEDENKTKELVDSMSEKGMKNPNETLSKNADKIIKKFNEIAVENKLGSKLDFLALSHLKNLAED